MKEFFALALEDEGSLHLISIDEGHFPNDFSSIENARKCRDRQDCSEAISIVRVQVVE